VPAPRSPQARALVRDQLILQRERKRDVPTWLWSTACIVVLTLGLALISALAWGVGRVGRAVDDARPRRRSRFAQTPAGTPA
jgi:hypothetical protein